MKIRFRRSFILFETLTASVLALLTIAACTSLFFFLWKTSIRQQKEMEKEGLRWRRISTLRWTLSRIKRTNKEDPFVLDGSDGKNARLIFVFDHGVHINPKLANSDLAQLYLDNKQGLVLVTRSHPKRACIGQDEEVASVIWPGVRSIQWRFAFRPKDKADKVGAEQYMQDNWSTAWRPDWKGLPAVIQVIIEDEDNVKSVVTAVVLQDIGAIALK
jgi:hypothetical protein